MSSPASLYWVRQIVKYLDLSHGSPPLRITIKKSTAKYLRSWNTSTRVVEHHLEMLSNSTAKHLR